jgi:hypothetical protein
MQRLKSASRLAFALAVVLVSSCATTAPHQAPPPAAHTTPVELTVHDVDADLLKELQDQMARVPELRSVQLKSHNGKTAVFSVEYPGDVSELPKTLAQMPHPGLKFGSALYQADYSAYDNQPPTITVVFPKSESLLNAKEQFVTVDVPDKDIKEVTIGGKPAQPYRGTVYRTKLVLVEGPQEITATATDKAGNSAEAKVKVTVDTSPPALSAQVKLIVEGDVEPGTSVLVDGQEVDVSMTGHYKAEVPVRKGQKKVEVVAISKAGNKTVTQKSLGGE